MPDSSGKHRDRPPTLLSKLGLSLGTILVTLLFLELGLRWFGYEGARERAHATFDDQYGDITRDAWIYTTPLDRAHPEAEIEGYHYHFDKAPGRTRIVFIGDSGTYGAGVKSRFAFPRRFADRLPSEEKEHFDVMNLGIIGMNTVGELKLLRDRILPLDPNIVVLGVFMANDIQFNLQYTKQYQRAPTINALRRHSALAHFVYLKLLTASSNSSSLGRAIDISPVEEHGIPLFTYVPGEFTLYISPMGQSVQLAFDVMESALREFRDLTKARHAQLAIVLIPTLSTIEQRLAFPGETGEEKTHLELLKPGERVDVDQPTRELHRICETLKIPLIDPTEGLRAKLGTRTFIKNDDHLSVEGHEYVAGELLERFDFRTRQFSERRP